MTQKAVYRLVMVVGVAWAILPLGGLAQRTGTAAEPINVGSQSQLFVDQRLIASATGIELVVNRPKKMGRVFAPQEPWEEYRIFVESVIHDGDTHRMYYSCMPSKPAGTGGTINCRHCGRETPDDTVIHSCGWCPSVKTRARMFGNIAYAESKDGIHWERPNLGQKEFDGTRANNLILHGGCVVSVDPNRTRGMRFLSLASELNLIKLVGSRDGRVFHVLAEDLSPFGMDTANQILWDRNCEKYVAYLRGFPGRPVKLRFKLRGATLYSFRFFE